MLYSIATLKVMIGMVYIRYLIDVLVGVVLYRESQNYASYMKIIPNYGRN